MREDEHEKAGKKGKALRKYTFRNDHPLCRKEGTKRDEKRFDTGQRRQIRLMSKRDVGINKDVSKKRTKVRERKSMNQDPEISNDSSN